MWILKMEKNKPDYTQKSNFPFKLMEFSISLTKFEVKTNITSLIDFK